MPVTGLNHINIRTLDPAASGAFYAQVLGLDYRQEPGRMGQRHWLYNAAGQAIIHFSIVAAESVSTGPIDHVALDCTDMAGVVARLQARGTPFETVASANGATILLVQDPHGVNLELSFAGP